MCSFLNSNFKHSFIRKSVGRTRTGIEYDDADPCQSRDSLRPNQALLSFFQKITINGKYFTSNSSLPINSLFKVKFQCWSLTSIRNLLPGRRVQQVVYRTPALLSSQSVKLCLSSFCLKTKQRTRISVLFTKCKVNIS